MDRYDAIVVGLGAMGSAAAAHIARRGKRVLGIEQFDLGHSRGSSHGTTRMIRMCYYEHTDYVPLLRRAYELWRETEHAADRPLLHITGGIYIGPPDSEALSGASRAAAQHRLDHELLDRAALAARFSQFCVPDDHAALFEPLAGYLVPEDVIAAHVSLARAAGAALHDNERVVSCRADGPRVRVSTTRAEYEAERIIFACGAWATRLVRDLGIEVRATRQVLGWVTPRTHTLFAQGTCPVWAIDCPRGDAAIGLRAGLYYGFPTDAGAATDGRSDGRGFKIARHAIGPATNPDTNDFTPRHEDEADFRPALRAFIPAADGPLSQMRICMYENSPDGHFIIDRHPRMPNAIVACGFSGHGFKFAGVVGETLADLAIDGSTRHPIGFLGLSRFSRKP
ncbi:MAG: N-methyl-L-tryptophan oxidase [Phycisphaeraceae bacterium]|nr:N-methyl-L-tryptophan oxidase [Phycisphaeraceae bacterium]